jgi:hypothetical protein
MTLQKKVGTRYQKCRRLYDILHTECFTYYDSRTESLKKVFYDSSNGAAAELLYSYPNPEQTGILKQLLSSSSADFAISSPIPVSTVNMLRIFKSAKIGNLSNLVASMKGIAASCAGIKDPSAPPAYESINLIEYRMKLGEALLNKKDWGHRTLLHVAIDARSA